MIIVLLCLFSFNCTTTVKEFQQDVIYNHLIQEVEIHIQKSLQPKNLFTELSADSIVYYCLKYNYDIPLLLSQGWVESFFGTVGRAIKTNSVFSIGAWDNKTVTTYQTINSCIEPYIIIMQRDYLTNKTINELLNNFINKHGYRYATNTKYEQAIRKRRNHIIKNTNIYKIQQYYTYVNNYDYTRNNSI